MQAKTGDIENGDAGMIDENSMARANFYAFLSRMFVEEPPFELIEDIVQDKIKFPTVSSHDDFTEGMSLFSNFAEGDKNARDIHEKLCREFTRLFIGPVPLLYPYESRYIDGSMMAKSLIKVKEEYRKAQLKKVNDYHEPEDHIAMELGFMSNLCIKETKESIRKQSDFLQNHLSKWVPAFCDELCAKSNNDFYKGIGKITKGFLISEREFLDM